MSDIYRFIANIHNVINTNKRILQILILHDLEKCTEHTSDFK